jgi:DNA-binding SARP family transcriptional activator
MSARPQPSSEAPSRAQGPLEFRLLGPLEVRREGDTISLGGVRQRAVLALLCLHRGEVVAVDQIIDEIWGESPPASARHMVEVYVSKLRRLLGPTVLVTRSPGYLLDIGPQSVDAERFEGLVADGEEASMAGEPQAAASRFASALALWRGPALADFTFEPFAQGDIARLEELRLLAEEGRIDAEIALGRSAELVGELERFVAQAPFRERFHGQLMLALYRAGRQADALEAYRRARQTLVEELGVEPGQALRALERAILAQEAWLGEPPARARVTRVESRRVVTLVLAELAASGPDADPEALQPLMKRQVAAAQNVLQLHGAAVEQFPDGTVMGVIGSSVAHEDDALRGLRAAIDLREQGITSRAVVDTSEVLAGEDRRVSGPAIRAAALLLAAAPPGTVLVGREGRGLTAHTADFASPLSVDGSAAWPLLRVRSDASILPFRLDVPFVGRDEELSKLQDVLAQTTRDRTPRLLTVVGEPGIGKSRLARAFADELGVEARVAVGRCLAYGEGITYSPLRDVLQMLATDETPEALAGLVESAPDADETARRLAGAVGFAAEAHPVEEIRWAVRRFFETLAQDGPLVLMFEDIHWAESTFLDLLSHVVSIGERAPIFLLCMARPELFEQHPEWAKQGERASALRLQGLPSEDAGRLASRLGVGFFSDDRRQIIVEAANGNPLFLEQLIAFALDRVENREGFDLPPSLRALLAARLDRLGPGERAVLECAAVVGRDFSMGEVAELLPSGGGRTLRRHLGSLESKGLVESGRPGVPFDEALRFRHILLQDATYRSVSKERRSGLHERLAYWFADQSGPAGDEIIGYHFEQAYRYRTELGVADEEARTLALRAGEKLSAAGESALARNDLPAAVKLLARATTLQEAGGEPRLDLRVELGAALFHVGQGTRALAVLEEALAALRATDQPALEWRTRLERNYVLSQLEPGALSNEEGLRAAEAAIRALEGLGDHRALARAWLSVTLGRFWLGQHESALEASERAVDCARQAGDRQRETWALRVRCMALWSGPRPAAECAWECEEIAANAKNKEVAACALQNLAGLRAMQGRFKEARRLVDQSLAIYEELGLTIRIAITLGLYSAGVHGLEGDEAAAERDHLKAIELLEPLGEKAARATITAMLAGTLYELGRYSEAERQADLSVGIAPEDDWDSHNRVLAVRAKLLARRGEKRRAMAMIDEAMRLAEATDDIDQHGCLSMHKAEVLRLTGEPQKAASCLERAIELLERKGNVALTRRARAQLADIHVSRESGPTHDRVNT